LESRSDGRKEKPRQAGPVRQREERGKGWRRAGPGKGNGAGGGTFGPRGKKKKGRERKERWAGWAGKRKGVKERFFFIFERIQTHSIQIQDFKFKLNNKQ